MTPESPISVVVLQRVPWLVGVSILVDHEIYAWGNNIMGQCGLGNVTNPVSKPTKVINVDGLPFYQVHFLTSY